MTTDANIQFLGNKASESGQSVIEFALLLPMMIALLMVLIRINMTIQMSLVNQQYARAQALFLSFNSPYYPELSKQVDSLFDRQTNQLVAGVGDTLYNDANPGQGQPDAQVGLVTRSRNVFGSEAPQTEPDTTRSRVRIRDTVTLCTQTVWLGRGGPLKNMVRTGAESFQITQYNLNDSTDFTYLCGSQLAYEQ